MSNRIYNWLAESVLAYEKALGTVPMAEVDKRITALREVFNPTSPEKFQEAMTIAQFSHYFGTVLSREFVKEYDTYPGSWKSYTYADSAPDFRDVDRMRADWYLDLKRRDEKESVKAGYVDTSHYFQYAVEEFASQIDISWRVFLNDDLNKIHEAPQQLAKAALRFEDMFVSNLYDNAVTQAALIALGAPWSGTGRLTAANLAIGINAMITRTTPEGYPMNLRKINLVIPPLLKLQADTILQSALMAGVATNDKNVLPGYISGVYTDPYITTAAPNVPWYLFADPAEVRAVSVARLAGASGPVVYMPPGGVKLVSGSAPTDFTMGSFVSGDIEFAVSDFIGGWDDASLVGVTDFRGIYYSNGTTP